MPLNPLALAVDESKIVSVLERSAGWRLTDTIGKPQHRSLVRRSLFRA